MSEPASKEMKMWTVGCWTPTVFLGATAATYTGYHTIALILLAVSTALFAYYFTVGFCEYILDSEGDSSC